jgi:murein DD-endopeptidase MepM/ murein hydrolase activator NlpD
MTSSSATDRRYAYHPHREKAPRRKAASPMLKIGAACVFLALLLWASATTLYLLFRDDALRMLASHQTELVRAYDGQIAVLQSQVQRLQSLKLVEQERVDRTVAELVRKQTVVEQRQDALATIAPKPTEAQDAPRPRISNGRAPDTFPMIERTPSMKPSPISDQTSPALPSGRSSELPGMAKFAMLDPSRPIDARLAGLTAALAKIEARQQDSLARYEQTLGANENRALNVLADLGIAAPAAIGRASAVGGPFIPLPYADAFDQKLAGAQETVARLADLNSRLETIPVRFPVPRGSEITSGFGARADPFFHQLALHSGVDFRGVPGDAVRATAAGRVTNADYQGGYGLMVEVTHGNGLVTRYGHLSAIEVNAGQEVQTGDVVGRIGTTGRSTGPHLHYEVRVSGEAVDPMRYLRAGEQLNDAVPAAVPIAVTAASPVLRSAPKTQLISND